MDSISNTIRRTTGGLRATRGLSLGFGLLRRRLWLWPLLAAVGLAIAGLVIRLSVENAIRQKMANELQTLLNTSVAALELWMEDQLIEAQEVANEPEVRRLANELRKLAHSPTEDAAAQLVQSEPQAELKKVLRSILGGGRYAGYILFDQSGQVLACNQPQLIGTTPPEPYGEMVSKCLRDGATVTRPFPSVGLLRDDQSGQVRSGVPTMLALAEQRNLSGDVIGVFGLRIRPQDDFSRLLQIARPGRSGETYAFDRDGLLLSESRFTADLKRMGLVMDQPDARSQLVVQLRDPGLNLATGKRPNKSRAEQPPTEMLARALSGESAANVTGYRDYRGVPVIGAWTWLPKYEMGVVTEVDVAEAYEPLYIVRRAFWGLFGLLAASSVLIFVFSFAMARIQNAAQRAALAVKELGQYQLEEKLGEGGMGVVYRGRHRMLRRPTAIKLLHPDKTTDAAVARFEREVQLTCQLNHPNTIAIYDYGRTPEGIFYYAMEFLEGINLEDLVRKHGAQPAGRVNYILRQICGSLAEAHELGLVHRDIKPANIVLGCRGGESDVVKVLDFGLVKATDSQKEAALTSAGSVIGTPLYMSPESIEFPDQVDGRSDLYAMAAVGYFLVTGTPPFDGHSVVEICMHHSRTPPEPPSQRLKRHLEPGFEAVLLKGLSKNPVDRFATARDFAEALVACDTASTWTHHQAAAWWRSISIGQPVPAGAESRTQVSQAATVVLAGGGTVADNRL